MTALAADRNITRRPSDLKQYPVAASTTIYKGGLVALNANGYAVPAADTAGLMVIGVADEKVDNSSGSNGDKKLRVGSGSAYLFNATSITQAMLGDMMYVVDDNTFDDAAGATNEIACGRLIDYVGSTEGWIFIPVGGVLSDVADLSIATGDIQDDAVTNAKIADDAVDTDQIADNAVEAAQIASNAVTTAKILDANVTNAKLAAGGPGFVTGEGGAVTQITDATTGVTLNKRTGQITTVALTTAAAAEERFTVTDSEVDANDIVALSTTYNGGGTPMLSVVNVAAGAFDIVITNVHASAALDAVMVINFAVIKGVAA